MPNKIDWLNSIEKFIETGDFHQIRAAAREIFELDGESADGPAAFAEAEAYLGNFDSVEYYLYEAETLKKSFTSNLRLNFIKSFVYTKRFKPLSAVKVYEKALRDENILRNKKQLIKTDMRDGTKLIYLKILERYFAIAINNYALLGEANKARDTLYLASELSVYNSIKLYSHFIFFTNYRLLSTSEFERIFEVYAKLWEKNKRESLYRLEPKPTGKPIRIGYVSKIFREHATLPFLPGLLTPPKGEKFEVFGYNLGAEDKYSRKLREFPVHWRNFSVLSPKDVAQRIVTDKIDILIDLAGHAEGSVIDVLSYRPAPIQVSAVGYFGSIGAPFIDYVLSDKLLMPNVKSERIIEKPLLLNSHSALCFAPLDTPQPQSISMPIEDNAYPTFLCNQNLLKVTDDLLLLWKQVFNRLGDFRLILQNKTISIPEGKQHLQKRLKDLGFKLSQITFLPFSPDYRKNFKLADIALDTAPYPGGDTTAEALYHGLPVITLRGKEPWGRLGASILTFAGLEELIAESSVDYAKKMMDLSTNPEKLRAIKTKILTNLKTSKFMDVTGYSKEVFDLYKQIYKGM